jgi:methionyl-tRNA formyltransferase
MPLNIVFMGTPDFAVPCLRRILEDGHTVKGVFTQPDKPVGRHQVLTPPPVKTLALEQGLPVYQPVKLRDGTALELLQTLAPDLIVVVAYGRILPRDILDCPRLGCVNVHGSILPKYRGAAPIQWTVLNGEETAGVTTMFMAEELDAGDIIQVMTTPVLENETSGELYDRLAPLGAKCLSQTLSLFAQGAPVPRIPQDHSQMTLAPMLEKSMGELDFQKPAKELHNLIRGLNPWPSAWTTIQGKRLKVHRSEIVESQGKQGKPGEVLTSAGERFIVACGQGSLALLEVQLEGKTKMPGATYLAGARFTQEKILGQ